MLHNYFMAHLYQTTAAIEPAENYLLGADSTSATKPIVIDNVVFNDLVNKLVMLSVNRVNLSNSIYSAFLQSLVIMRLLLYLILQAFFQLRVSSLFILTVTLGGLLF